MKKLSWAIRVLVAGGGNNDESQVSAVLKTARDIKIVGTIGNRKSITRALQVLRPDVVLVENPIGLRVIRTLASNGPPMRILIVSDSTQANYIKKVIRAGARGYVLTPYVRQELVSAVRTLHAGYCFFSPTIESLTEGLVLQGS